MPCDGVLGSVVSDLIDLGRVDEAVPEELLGACMTGSEGGRCHAHQGRCLFEREAVPVDEADELPEFSGERIYGLANLDPDTRAQDPWWMPDGS